MFKAKYDLGFVLKLLAFGLVTRVSPVATSYHVFDLVSHLQFFQSGQTQIGPGKVFPAADGRNEDGVDVVQLIGCKGKA